MAFFGNEAGFFGLRLFFWWVGGAQDPPSLLLVTFGIFERTVVLKELFERTGKRAHTVKKGRAKGRNNGASAPTLERQSKKFTKVLQK